MKQWIDYLGKNWMLGMIVFCLSIFLGCITMVKVCDGILSKVEYPAHNERVYRSLEGELYILVYSETKELSIITSNEAFRFSGVKTAIPEMDIVRVIFEDGRETTVNVCTKTIDHGGILL